LDPAILDTAIGLIFVFLLVSLIVSAATELISAWLSWRAENLWAGIQNLLDSPRAKDWVTKLYEHPLVEGLSRSRTKGFALAKLLAPAPKGPSYIPSRTLLDLIQQGDVSISRIRRSLLEVLDRTPSSAASVRTFSKLEVKAVWSFWSKPEQHRVAWPSQRHHLMAWVLSLQTVRQHYRTTMLCTDTAGARLLIDTIGLEFGHVSTALDALEHCDPGRWALGETLRLSCANRSLHSLR